MNLIPKLIFCAILTAGINPIVAVENHQAIFQAYDNEALNEYLAKMSLEELTQLTQSLVEIIHNNTIGNEETVKAIITSTFISGILFLPEIVSTALLSSNIVVFPHLINNLLKNNIEPNKALFLKVNIALLAINIPIWYILSSYTSKRFRAHQKNMEDLQSKNKLVEKSSKILKTIMGFKTIIE